MYHPSSWCPVASPSAMGKGGGRRHTIEGQRVAGEVPGSKTRGWRGARFKNTRVEGVPGSKTRGWRGCTRCDNGGRLCGDGGEGGVRLTVQHVQYFFVLKVTTSRRRPYKKKRHIYFAPPPAARRPEAAPAPARRASVLHMGYAALTAGAHGASAPARRPAARARGLAILCKHNQNRGNSLRRRPPPAGRRPSPPPVRRARVLHMGYAALIAGAYGASAPARRPAGDWHERLPGGARFKNTRGNSWHAPRTRRAGLCGGDVGGWEWPAHLINHACRRWCVGNGTKVGVREGGVWRSAGKSDNWS
jgi:hypothetical protein